MKLPPKRLYSLILVTICLILLTYVLKEKAQIPADNFSESIVFSTEEINWIKKNPVVSVGVDLDFIPIEYLDQEGNYVGVTGDFLEIISEKTGLVFEIDKKHTWEETYERVIEGKIQMVAAAVSSEERTKYLDFTAPYVSLAGVIIVRDKVSEEMDMDKLRSLNVTVVKKYIWEDIMKTSYPDIHLSPAPNIEAALKKVSFGMADAMVGYMATASHHIERLGISNLKISGGNVSVLDVSFAVNNEFPLLHSIIDRVLQATPDSKKKAIVRKWISLELNTPKDLKVVTRTIFIGVVIGLLLLTGITILNRSLQRQVNQRTQKLNQELAQRKRIEQALRESEEKYRSIFGNIQDVYYETTLTGEILEISPSVENVFGYSRSSIMQKSLSYMFANRQDFQEMLDKVTENEQLTDYETLLVQPDGLLLNCSINATLNRTPTNKKAIIIGSIRNISDRIKAQKALKVAYHELEKRVEERTAELVESNTKLNIAKEAADAATLAKSNFLANMSHEIRTPLTGVISASELAMNEQLSSKKSRFINLINISGHALLGVIDDILDFSKIEAGKLVIENHHFNLYRLISRVTDLFKLGCSDKKINFVVDLEPRTPHHLRGDSFRLQQILTNLLSNAVKFTDEKGSITLHVSGKIKEAGSNKIEIIFLVEDTGIGIAPKHQDLLFTPFSQVDASITRKYGGSGLGLSICGQLVEMMNGNISVESQSNKGSRFRFMIPLEVSEIKESEKNDDKSDTSLSIATYRTLLSGKSVLVAEDTPTNQEIALAVLELVGIRTMLVDTGKKAVAAVEKHTFDAVLMDIQMPEMDGYNATRRIRKLVKEKHIPIIGMTAHTFKEDMAKCLDAGMDGYISKPVSHQKVFDTLVSLVIKKRPWQGNDFEAELHKASLSVHTELPLLLPGLAIHDALHTLGIHDEAYLQCVRVFVKQNEQILSTLHEALSLKDRGTFEGELHSLKGSASGIGANAVHSEVLKIETLCKEAKTKRSIKNIDLATLEKSMSTVLGSIESLLQLEKDTQKKSLVSEVDREKTLSIFEALGNALDLPEIRELDELMKELKSTVDQDKIALLDNHIASYDFDLAKEHLIELQTQLRE